MNLNAPVRYEEEFFYSGKEKAISTILGIIFIIVGVKADVGGSAAELVQVALIVGGLFFAYMGIKEIIDRKPKLKLAKKGLWTKKLGFVDWNNIAKIRVTKTGPWLYRETLLEIYLKKAFFEEPSQPDEMLDLTHAADKEYLEAIMNI